MDLKKLNCQLKDVLSDINEIKQDKTYELDCNCSCSCCCVSKGDVQVVSSDIYNNRDLQNIYRKLDDIILDIQFYLSNKEDQ